jgi:CHAT domain-containing protein
MKQIALRLICFVLLAAHLPVFNFAQTQTDLTNKQTVSNLELSKNLDREIKGGEEHIYTIKFETGRFSIVIYRYSEIDLTAKLFAPGITNPRTATYPTDGKTPLNMTIWVREPGLYRLEVRSSVSGRYRVWSSRIAEPIIVSSDPLLTPSGILRSQPRDIRVRKLSTALVNAETDEERTALLSNEKELITVKLLYELIEQGKIFTRQANYEKGLLIARLTLQLAEQIGDKAEISFAFYNLGVVLMTKGDYAEALSAARKSLAMYESLITDDSARTQITIAARMFLIGSIYQRQNDNAQALAYYKRSLTLYQSTKDIESNIRTLMNIGTIYLKEGNQAQAGEVFENSFKLREDSGNKAGLILTLLSIGSICSSEGSQELGAKYYQKSLDLGEELGDKPLLIRVLTALASFSLIQGNHAKSLQYYEKILKLCEESGDRTGAAATFGFISFVYLDRQDFLRALEYSQKALKLYEELENPSGITYTLSAMSNIYVYQGNYAGALECHESALSLHEKLGNQQGVAAALSSIGFVYSAQGNKEKALEYYRKSLKLREKLNDTNYIPGILFSIESLNGKSDFTLRMEFYQKNLTMYEASANKRGMLTVFSSMGWLAKQHGKYDLALEYFQKYLKLSQLIGDNRVKVEALWHFADIYYLQKKYDKALEFAEQTSSLGSQVGRHNYSWLGKLIAGKVYRELNQLNKAQQSFEESISIIETTRSNMAGEEERTRYFSQVQQAYELYIDVLMQKYKELPLVNSNIPAFEASERARARSLLELLNEANTDIRQGVEPQLLERERSLQQQLNARAEQQTRLLSGQHTPEQAEALKKEIDALTFDYRNNQAQIRLKSPRYAALTQPQPLKLSEIQKELLDADTVLLEYSLGEKQSYLWAVTKDSIKSYELPPRAEIETTVSRAYALLSDGNQVIDEKAQAAYEMEAARISKIILAPVAAQIKNKRIVIVADGALQYLPFGALPSPNSKENNRQPLIAENEIVSLPSASTLAVLRRQVKGRTVASKTIAVFADPVFNPTDERVKPIVKSELGRQKPQSTSSKRDFVLENAVVNTGIMRDGIVQRLPFSRAEAKSILDAAPTGGKMQALDFQANRETALSAEMSQYRRVHFATHGIFNSENPELSGIVLSLVNEQGQPVDGFLRLNEIYNMNLSADLVVLSACQTALGKEIKGEGLIGLTRGFMYAGSPRVVASLWKVDDVATAELMKIFYQKMLQENMTPAAALRAAKIEMWKQKRWNSPFYWAAFELQGEWR